MQWQINDHIKEFKYVKLNFANLQLIIFTNSFFANNRDLFSQIDYVICLTNLKHVNIVHWSSIKYKRVIRSVFATKLYALAHDFDFEAILKATMFNIFDHFVFLIFCIDSKSLYDCLIKLDITQKKRFMIDVMNLRQSYKRRKIIEMKWIYEINNSIDFMIKNKTFSILKTLIYFNTINMNINEWIERLFINKNND